MSKPKYKKAFFKGFVKAGIAKGLDLKGIKKMAIHAYERGSERLQLPRESVDDIQKAVDKMWFSYGRHKLNETFYYSPIKDKDKNLQGYAAFKRVGKHPYNSRLILTTILDRSMRPKGHNIGNFLDSSVKAEHKLMGHQPKKYDGMPPIPNATTADRKPKDNPHPTLPTIS